MSAYTLDELLPIYSREEISAEQAVGHILQNLVQMQKSMESARKDMEMFRKEQELLRRENERLRAFVGMENGE